MCKCPKCDTELKKLKIKDTTDENWFGDTYIGQGYGYCPKCKTEYWIDMVYKFSHYEIEEIEGEN